MAAELQENTGYAGLYTMHNELKYYAEGWFVLLEADGIPRNFPDPSAHYLPVTEEERQDCVTEQAQFQLRHPESNGFAITFRKRGYSVLSRTILSQLTRV